MSETFRFLLLSAMYENGGNVTHRHLDGHPQMFVYPFESQLGTRLVVDPLTSMFPVKYRWPVFPLDATAGEDYEAIIDEELKVRVKTPKVSKFRHMPMDLSDENRKTAYIRYVQDGGRSRANNMASFFRATFDAWKDVQRTGEESVYVGYSPIVIVDAEKILKDLPQSQMLHVVRNPWSAYADTKKRPVPLSLSSYMIGWTLNQYYALLFQKKFPGRVHIVRLEDVVAHPLNALGPICNSFGLEKAKSLDGPTWNGTPLEEVYPWGTIRSATSDANRATALELSAEEQDEIRARTWQYLDVFDYKSFI
jgi:hypothetical protein